MADVDMPDGHIGVPRESAIIVCRSRWALVKALVLGHTYTLAARSHPDVVDVIHRLHMQRDAVYTALHKIAMAEEALSGNANAVLKMCERKERRPNRDDDDASPCANLFRVYLGHLIEQVGLLGVAP